jgi:hypothetical protein
MRITRLYPALTLVFLAACAAPQPKFQSLSPKAEGAASYVLNVSGELEQTSYMLQYLNKDKTMLYFQNFGGGGAGLGLLGPLGVAANISMIETNTKTDVDHLQGKINVSPREVFMDAAKQKGFELDLSTSPSPKPSVTPYLYFSKTEGDVVLAGAAILVRSGSGAAPWKGKYLYQLPLKYKIDELASLDANATEQLKAAAREGFTKLIAHLSDENQDRFAKEQQILLKSDLLSPRFSFQMIANKIAEDGSVVWVRTQGGVFAIQKSNVSIEQPK